MAYEIGYVDNTGSEGLAHWQMLAKIKQLAEANGWSTLRYTTPTDGTPRELILRGGGLSGTDEIYIGFRAYHNAAADYYNLTTACMAGYAAALPFEAQPGYVERALCTHDRRIDFWAAVNAQRIAMALKVGAPSTYEIGYVGKYLPYGTPGQCPYPVVCIGTLPAAMPATRYSDTSPAHSCGARGVGLTSPPAIASGALRDMNGMWRVFGAAPWTQQLNNTVALQRDTGGYVPARKAVLFTGAIYPSVDAGRTVWGELDGLGHVSGFGNVSEDTAVIDGVTHAMFGDVFRTGIDDYFLLRMS